MFSCYLGLTHGTISSASRYKELRLPFETIFWRNFVFHDTVGAVKYTASPFTYLAVFNSNTLFTNPMRLMVRDVKNCWGIFTTHRSIFSHLCRLLLSRVNHVIAVGILVLGVVFFICKLSSVRSLVFSSCLSIINCLSSHQIY